jgi:Cd2+/Zn2+-exporting ATPase
VLIATATLIFAPTLFFGGLWAKWFYRAMAFLTAASPCALAIGTPAAVLSGIARAARIGVLVKGGVHLENLGRIRAIAFDKTGTLTTGRAEVTDVLSIDPSISEVDLIALAASVESESNHPLARAIVGDARARGCKIPAPQNVTQLPGIGVRAEVNGRSISAGRAELFASEKSEALENALAKLSSSGRTQVIIGIDEKPVGVIGLADRPRANAAESIARLRKLGIARTIVLSGDRAAVVDQVARDIGIDESHADLLPEQKLNLIHELQKRFGPIAMVGDGVNDAPALASATVGIAMGGAGTDVAIETADVALMADDLSKLPDAIGLGRFSRSIIRQNITLALAVICILAPLAAMGFTDLWFAVLFHEGSTVVVVLNSLRLLMYKPNN